MDADRVLRYHGAPDGDHDDPAQNASWLRDALDDLLAGRPVARPETSPIGCSIKWRVELRWWEGCPSHEQAEELLTATLRERVLDRPADKHRALNGDDAIAAVDKGLKAVGGDRAGLAVNRRADGRVGFNLRLGRNLAIAQR